MTVLYVIISYIVLGVKVGILAHTWQRYARICPYSRGPGWHEISGDASRNFRTMQMTLAPDDTGYYVIPTLPVAGATASERVRCLLCSLNILFKFTCSIAATLALDAAASLHESLLLQYVPANGACTLYVQMIYLYDDWLA
eukprot:1721038-Pleurochrysis_carterae.AAC.5